jgi:hypothetical protein
VGGESRREDSATAAGRCGCRNQSAVENLLPFPLLSVIHAGAIDKKAEEFDWRLGTVLFDCGHVDIVDENSNSLAWRRSELSTRFFKLFFNRLLDSVGRGLSRKVYSYTD